MGCSKSHKGVKPLSTATLSWLILLRCNPSASFRPFFALIKSHASILPVNKVFFTEKQKELVDLRVIAMPKRKRDSASKMSAEARNESNKRNAFRATTPSTAECLTDGVLLQTKELNQVANAGEKAKDNSVILPWVGFGTYRLGQEQAKDAVFTALEHGYRQIDTAFIYGGETTERLVGEAIQSAIDQNIISGRSDVFLTTKHWRKYHGYDESLECLRLSLKRLQVEYVDLWLMHWPGPAWKTMNRRKELVEKDRWHYAAVAEDEVAALRAETWRAMEDAVRQGLVRAIGVSNMTVEHLKKLKETATLWPPAVNQVEFHPLYPQDDLLKFCQLEGIVLQAYASLGGQDTGKKAWSELLGTSQLDVTTEGGKKKKGKRISLDLLTAPPVVELAERLKVTPAQILLRWGLDQGAALIPKTTSVSRMEENADIFSFHLSKSQIQGLQHELLEMVKQNNPDVEGDLHELTRLCWRSDPLRHLDFN